MPRLIRRIAPGLRQVRTECFPFRRFEETHGVEVWLGVGGNLGDSVRRFQRLCRYLDRQSDLRLMESSPILINPPFGYLDQPDFANAVLRIRTSLPPLRLLRRILEIERRFGRRRSFQDAPRTLDIDLLFYGGRRIEDPPRLRVPHPGWKQRASVLWPLAQMRRPGPDARVRRELKPLLTKRLRAPRKILYGSQKAFRGPLNPKHGH